MMSPIFHSSKNNQALRFRFFGWLLHPRQSAMRGNESGFTLVEIIMAIVLIGIAVPGIMMFLQGVEDTREPEYIIQGSFMAQKKIEELASETRTSIDTQIASVCNSTVDGDYTLTCTSTDVNATDPDTAAVSTFAKKITLTVSRSDGAMQPLEFTTLFALD